MSRKAPPGPLVQAFHSADLFNESVHFTLRGKRMQTTFLGGFLSLSLFAFVIYETVNQFIAMLERRDMLLYQINEIETEPVTLSLNDSNNFFLAVIATVNDVNVNMSLASPFNFRTTFNRYTRLGDGSRARIKYPVFWAPCNSSDFDIFGPETFSTLSLSYAYCAVGINFTNPNDGSCPENIKTLYPDCMTPVNLELKGGYLLQEFDFLQSNLVICNQSDPTLPYHMKCDSGNITEKFKTQILKLNLYYPTTLINPRTYEKPNKTLIDTVYWNLNPDIFKLADVFVDKITIQNFDSYFSTSLHNNQSYYAIQSDKMRQLESVQYIANNPLLQLNLRYSGYNTVISRTYTKMQDFLTDLGGFAKTLMFLAAVIASGYAKYQYSMILANELYDFEFPNRKPKTPSFRFRNRFEISETKSLNVASPTASGASPNKLSIKEYFDKKKARKPLRYDEAQYFKGFLDWCLCRTSIEEEIAKKGREFAGREIDVARIVVKAQEVDRLKNVYLNQEQIKAFDHMEMPLILLESNKPKYMDSVVASQARNKLLRARNIGEVNKLEENNRNKKGISWEEFTSLPIYGRLYVAYRYLKDDEEPSNEVINRKLIAMIDRNLMKIFRRIDIIVGNEFDSIQIQEILEHILEGQGDLTINSTR